MVSTSNDITTSRGPGIGASSMPLKSDESSDADGARFDDSRFELETSRGKLAFILPLSIASTIPSVAHGDRAKETERETISTDREEPIGPVESSVATAVGISGLAVALAYGLALKNVIAAKRKLRRNSESQRSVLNSQVGREITSLIARNGEIVGNQIRGKTNGSDTNTHVVPGLSTEWTNLSRKFVDSLKADLDATRVPGMVGPSLGLAGYWQDIGHSRNSDIMHFGAKMLLDEVYGARDIETWLDLREIFFRRFPFPVMRRYSASDLYRTLAKEHERIGRRKRHGTQVYDREIALVKSLHFLAAAMLWRMRAGYLDDWKPKLWALTSAKVDVGQAIDRLKDVEGENGAFWDEKGVTPLADLQHHAFELRDRINMEMRQSINPPPPNDFGGIARSPRAEEREPTGPLDHSALVPVSYGALSFAGVAIPTLAFVPII
jgi:hypothetical protein